MYQYLLPFFHPDYTVGPVVSPGHGLNVRPRGLYRRSGISPCPEELSAAKIAIILEISAISL